MTKLDTNTLKDIFLSKTCRQTLQHYMMIMKFMMIRKFVKIVCLPKVESFVWYSHRRKFCTSEINEPGWRVSEQEQFATQTDQIWFVKPSQFSYPIRFLSQRRTVGRLQVVVYHRPIPHPYFASDHIIQSPVSVRVMAQFSNHWM